ncbi:hypothetical protein [Cohnella soli]|uniref:MFS transporter n=1 Tax=Cohnella soli TaxID=425005 RepID=A0ABW0HP39_9BACL
MNVTVRARSFIYFFISFLGTGIQNIIPQVFFSQNVQESKMFWLSVCLVLGSVGSIVIIWCTHSAKYFRMQGSRPRSIKWVVAISLALSVLASASLLLAAHIALFMASFFLTRTASQLFINVMDRYYVHVLPKADISSHSRNTTLSQLIGMMLAPIYFSLTLHRFSPLLNWLVLFAGFSAVAVIVWHDLRRLPQGEPIAVSSSSAARSGATIGAYEILFLGYVIALSSASMLFSSNLIFALADLYHMEHAVVRSGLLLTIIHVMAIVAVFMTKLARGRSMTVRIHLPLSLLMLASLVLFFFPANAGIGYLAAIGASIGCVYGLFSLYARKHATEWSVQTGRPVLLSLYNNQSSYAIVVSSLAAFVLSLISGPHMDMYLHLLIASVSLFVVIAVLIAAYLGLRKSKAAVDGGQGQLSADV